VISAGGKVLRGVGFSREEGRGCTKGQRDRGHMRPQRGLRPSAREKRALGRGKRQWVALPSTAEGTYGR